MRGIVSNSCIARADEPSLVGPSRRRSSATGWRSLVLVASLCVPAANVVAASPSPDQRYVAHLRDLGMHRLAEVYCRERLAADGLTDRERVELAMELSLVAVGQAYNAPPGERDTYWRKAYAALEGWLATADRPFRLLLELQDALNMLAEAELARLEQVGYSDAAAIDVVRSRVRSGIASLRSIADGLEVRRRQFALGQARGPVEFTDRELAGLERSVALALARGFREQAFTYPANSPDHVNALQQAAESLAALAATTPADELTWQARVTLAECFGELGQVEPGLTAVAKWQADGPPAEVSGQLVAAEAKLLATAGRVGEALGKLGASGVARGSSPTIDLVKLEVLVAAEPRDDRAIDSLLASIRQSYSPRHVRQAEALVGQAFAASGDVTTAAGKVHAAEHFYRAGQLDRAVATYDQAAEMYRDARDRERAFAAERSAAAIVQRRGNFGDAAERFRRLALGSVDREGSATDHREAILSLATAVKQSPPAAGDQTMADYLQICREHLRHWPTGPTAGEVRWWLARALASRGQWQATLDVLSEIDETSPYYEPAMALLATAYRQRIAGAVDATERQSLVAEAVARLQPVVVGTEDRIGWPNPWSDAQRTCALELARLKIDSGDASYAEKMLEAAIVRGQPPASAEYHEAATPVLAMALVTGGKTAEAIDLLRESARGDGAGASLESLAERLTLQLGQYSRDETSRATERAAIGQLLLATLEVAGDDKANWRLPPDRYRAAALAAVANETEALRLYQSLVKKYPKDGDLQEEYAQLLAAEGTASGREAALAKWSGIERASRRGSERWKRAREARIDLLVQLGRQDEAEKLRTLTKLLGGR